MCLIISPAQHQVLRLAAKNDKALSCVVDPVAQFGCAVQHVSHGIRAPALHHHLGDALDFSQPQLQPIPFQTVRQITKSLQTGVQMFPRQARRGMFHSLCRCIDAIISGLFRQISERRVMRQFLRQWCIAACFEALKNPAVQADPVFVCQKRIGAALQQCMFQTKDTHRMKRGFDQQPGFAQAVTGLARRR